ncbi:MAG: hypothetical protein WCB31_09830 [Nitrososphaeraceae archaeon]|nr:hypothetical protein [Nitrososphaeraceae archaeon]
MEKESVPANSPSISEQNQKDTIAEDTIAENNEKKSESKEGGFFKKVNSLQEKLESNEFDKGYLKGVSNLRLIILGLFSLIGFIVVVYAILVAVVGEQVVQVANVFFVVTIVSISILVGTLVYQIRGSAILNNKQ